MREMLNRVADSLPELNTKADQEGESPKCPVCRGAGWTLPQEGDPSRPWTNRPVPCSGCPAPLGVFFEHLELTDDNRDAMEAAIKMAWDPAGWLVLVGWHGTGKTTILEAIASEWDGHKAIPFTAVGLLDYWQEMIGGNGEMFLRRFSQMKDRSLLALDDLARPKATDWTITRLTELLDYRYDRALPVVLTIDQDEEQIAEKFGVSLADRVFDRRTGLVRVVGVKGESYRTGRKW